MEKTMTDRSNLPVFKNFFNCVERSFGFLIKDGFVFERRPVTGFETGVFYSKPDIVVRIEFEHGSGPWVSISKRQGNKWETTPLHEALKNGQPELFSEMPSRPAKTESEVEEAISLWAKGLKAIIKSLQN